MRFERLTLRNFQSYDQLDHEFEEGLTLIHGPNGAGKSTIARALYTTLYPRSGRNHIGAHDLVDLIQDGADDATSELVFSVGDDRYRIRVDISRKSDGGARTDTEMTILETGETYSTRATDIENKVARLLGMDAKAFANSTYAQQTQLIRLIETSPSEREAILDNLLGLTAPDEHAEDVNELQKPIREWRNDKRSKLQAVRKRIDELEADDPQERVREKSDEVDRLDDQIAEVEEGLEEAEERLRDVEGDIEERSEQEAELEGLRGDLRDVEDRIDELEGEVEGLSADVTECNDAIAEQKELIDGLDDEVENFDLTDADEAEAAVDHFEDAYDETSAKVERRRGEVGTAEKDVERLEEDLQGLRDDLSEAQGDVQDAETTVEEAAEAVEEAEATLAERREERDEQLEAFLETPVADVNDHEAAVRDRMEEVRNRKSDLETERGRKCDRRERLGEEVGEARAELDEAEERRRDIRRSLDTDVGDPEAAFAAAVERADAAADPLGFEVDAEDIDKAFTGNLPAELEAAIDDHRGAAEGLANARERAGAAGARIDDLQALSAGEWPLDGGEIGASHDYDAHLDRLEAERETAEDDAEAAEDELDDAETRLDRVQTVAEALFEAASFRALVDVASEVAELETTIEETVARREALADDIDSLDAKIRTLGEQVDEGEDALEAVAAVEDAADAVEDAEGELDDAEADLEEATAELEELEADVRDVESDLEEAQAAVAEAERELEAVEDELGAVETARDAARSARDAHGEIERLESDRRGHRSRREDKREQLNERRDEADDLEGQIEELEDKLDHTPLDELRERKEKIEEAIGKLEDKLESLEEDREAANEERIQAESDLETLREERKKRDALEEQRAWAQGLLDDLDAVMDTYAEVQTRMREEVLDRLRYYTNEVFRELYRNSTYEAVDIDEDYNLRLVSGSDTARDPHKASGGEGVLVTIALRAGVYRVLADQAGGRDDRLPPFILDEPTNHLDDVHIGRLDDAVETIRDWDVPQVFVVDRYEGLVEGADHRIRVEMDDGAGTSTVAVDDEPTETAGGD